jgi:hypothetical protein
MESLIAGDLRLELAAPVAAAPLRLHWRGKSNDKHPAKVLGPYLTQIIAAAARDRNAVEMHFENLEHFNSSTITAIIQLIQQARTSGVRLVMVYDGALKWQKLSFDALKVFAKDDGLFELRVV